MMDLKKHIKYYSKIKSKKNVRIKFIKHKELWTESALNAGFREQ